MIGLVRMWRKVSKRAARAEAEQAAAHARLVRTRQEVEQLRRHSEQNRFAQLLREGISRGYGVQGGK